jgi:predicted RNA binding protein YcfA (HicA-like mRNA interferase family)
MPKLPRISSKEAIRTLERLGFYQIRQTGSHVIMKKQTINGEIGCVVPLHPELKVGTLSHKTPTDYVEISKTIYQDQSIEEIFTRAKQNWQD